VVLILFIGIICPGIVLIFSSSLEEARYAACENHLKQIGFALQIYHEVNGSFPPVNTCDKDGKPLLSWRAEILPQMEYSGIYKQLNKDEPWNTPYNAKLLGQFSSSLYNCSSANPNENNFNYKLPGRDRSGHGMAKGRAG
jgi:hypothetical protein